jgi:hypothetical protein
LTTLGWDTQCQPPIAATVEESGLPLPDGSFIRNPEAAGCAVGPAQFVRASWIQRRRGVC